MAGAGGARGEGRGGCCGAILPPVSKLPRPGDAGAAPKEPLPVLPVSGSQKHRVIDERLGLNNEPQIQGNVRGSVSFTAVVVVPTSPTSFLYAVDQ